MEIYHPTRVEKPWGYELIWAQSERYAGKILHIRKGESLSYQYHGIKDETIHLLHGEMELEIGDAAKREKLNLREGDCYHIAPGVRHRMLAIEDCEVLEVSTPELDDVIRLEDRYGRVEQKKKS